MKSKRGHRLGVAGLVIVFFFLIGFVAALQPEPVPEEEVVFAQAAHLNNRGVELYRQGKIQEALSNFIVASEMDDTFWQGHYNCAVALIAMKNLKEALHHLEMSMEIDPENPVSRRLYEDLYWRVEMIV
ncbi:MAG: tetratricopeptide repeat protein [Candidatus Manganitrophus sp.]|nr:tetratricopeptide repeat protein [Candidatus Manganitrophus sp.]MDC4225536.1 tetratricopeptide repeat protein [Candidatus Manganitrophus sp.]WDT73106.1 MAG: tetratricopeptide repeat protein [Candidatus Manganitrophus sp.]WDT79357.1 MAG: tetratricopeptide repeat protein [Candidatus Manganitrophus sp.]